MSRPLIRLLLICLTLGALSACHAGPRIEAAAREVHAEKQAEAQSNGDAPAQP